MAKSENGSRPGSTVDGLHRMCHSFIHLYARKLDFDASHLISVYFTHVLLKIQPFQGKSKCCFKYNMGSTHGMGAFPVWSLFIY